MTTPGRDPEYSSRIWVPPHACDHPRESINFQGHFPQENPELSVFAAHCLKCGSSWDQNSTDAPWNQLMTKIAKGEFGVVSFDRDDIVSGVEWQRQNRHDDIMRDVEQQDADDYYDNPILNSKAQLRRSD